MHVHMLPDPVYEGIIEFLKQQGNDASLKIRFSPVGGGCINQTLRLSCSGSSFFLKYNNAALFPGMFTSEAKGLNLLRQSGKIGVPEVLHVDETGGYAYLLLEFIDTGNSNDVFWARFGERLANLHMNTSSAFGLDHDNYIGSLPQKNTQHTDWAGFFAEERLLPQIQVARRKGILSANTDRAFEKFFRVLPSLFPPENPSLLHGDLWSGNFLAGKNSVPYIIDPAVYYGHREMDIAMSRLFGGFDYRFYEAYNYHFPLEKGWEKRLELCNLYPLMVHFNLFGGSYGWQVENALSHF